MILTLKVSTKSACEYWFEIRFIWLLKPIERLKIDKYKKGHLLYLNGLDGYLLIISMLSKPIALLKNTFGILRDGGTFNCLLLKNINMQIK